MKPRETIPSAESLERFEAPSKEVAEAHRKALAAEISDNPAFREALDEVSRSHGEGPAEALPLDLFAEIPGDVGADAGQLEREYSTGGPRVARKTAKLPDMVPDVASERRTGLTARTVLKEDAEIGDETAFDAEPHETVPTERERAGLVVGALSLLSALLVGAALYAMGAFGGAETAPTGTPADRTRVTATIPTTAQADATVVTTTTSPVPSNSTEPPSSSSSLAPTQDPTPTTSTPRSARTATSTGDALPPPTNTTSAKPSVTTSGTVSAPSTAPTASSGKTPFYP